MGRRTATKLLPFAVTAAACVAAFTFERGLVDRTDPVRTTAGERGAQAVEREDTRPGPGTGALPGPTVFTRFDIALLVLGSLGVIGFCLRIPGLVGATPFAGLPRLWGAVVARRRCCVRYTPFVVLGIVLMTATTAAAQTEAPDPPYVGDAPAAAATPYVGTEPGDEGPAAAAGAYVDALPYIAPSPVQSSGSLAVAPPGLVNSRVTGELVTPGAPVEGPSPSGAAVPVTAADVLGLAVLVGAVLASVLLPRWRCR